MSRRKVTPDELVEAEIACLHKGGIAIKRDEPIEGTQSD